MALETKAALVQEGMTGQAEEGWRKSTFSEERCH